MNLINKIISRFHISTTQQKVVKNLVWAVIGKIVTLLGSLLVGIFVARYLGPEQYGLMNYVFSYIAVFQVFASFGLDSIEIREEAHRNDEKNKLIGTAFLLKILFASITILLVVISVWIFEADTFTKWMIIMYSLSMIMNSFGVIRNYFTSIVWNEYIVKTEITRTIIGAGIKVALLLIHADLIWFILSTLFDTILLASGYIVSYRRKIDRIRNWTFDKTTALYLIKQSFPLLLSGAAVVIYQKIDQVMLGNMIDKTAVGYYSVAGKFTEICLFIPTILSQTITPILVKAYHENIDDYQRKAKSFMNITIWGTIIICIGICLISNPLIKYTFGTEYTAATILLQIMIFKTIGYASAQITGALIVIEEKQKYVVIRNIIGCLVCIGLNLLLIPQYGVVGAAIASVITAISTGYFSHLLIPSYRSYFYTQTYSFLYGWIYLIQKAFQSVKNQK